jgi:hypothetical protein
VHRIGCDADKILLTALRCVPFAERPAADQPRLDLLGQHGGELELIEIHTADIGMADLDCARVQVGCNENAGFARATDRVDAGPRLRDASRIGARPAIEPRHGRGRRPIGSDRIGAEILFGESLVERGSRVGQLAGDLGAQVGWRLTTAHPLHQRSGEPRRHEETDELAAPPRGNVDADHSTFGGDGWTAAHAGIERAGEMNLFAVTMLDQPVVGAPR